jgi:hypothetical protein
VAFQKVTFSAMQAWKVWFTESLAVTGRNVMGGKEGRKDERGHGIGAQWDKCNAISTFMAPESL